MAGICGSGGGRSLRLNGEGSRSVNRRCRYHPKGATVTRSPPSTGASPWASKQSKGARTAPWPQSGGARTAPEHRPLSCMAAQPPPPWSYRKALGARLGPSAHSTDAQPAKREGALSPSGGGGRQSCCPNQRFAVQVPIPRTGGKVVPHRAGPGWWMSCTASMTCRRIGQSGT